ncbi:MFS transporter [Sandaracinobacteroides hominis]|uniref:MFS transporter n=1 Tax=Sandaracinobacteroides hominis TaxID=2780086 RepID=UPI0018F41C0E|nr:MFS transporter [Sandaracinobacteroides hominis]
MDSSEQIDSPAPLSIPVFRAVWLASMASNFGGVIQSVGAAWMMTSLTSSPETVALVQASTAMPIMLFSLLAGAVADNRDRRRVMMASQAAMLAVSAGLAAAALAGILTPALLLTFTFLLGCGLAFNGPAWQASVGEMVPRGSLPGAVALNAMGFNIARSLGPALGGAIVAALGAAAAFILNAVSYVPLIWVLSCWRPKLPERLLPPEPLLDAMAAGVRYVALSPGIRIVLARALLFGFSAAAVPALMPLVARHIVAGGPLTYGLLLGAFGVGAVVSAILIRRIRSRLPTEQIVRIASALLATGAAITAISRMMPVTMAALTLCGAGWVLALATFNVTVQMSAPRWVVARALALYQMFAFGGMAVGAWVFGRLAEGKSVETALLWAAGAQVLTLAMGLWRPLPTIENLNLDPLARWKAPDTAVDVQPRSGPIVISVEYRIHEEDFPAFLDAMAERRRIRRRDGARRWTLLRDLHEADLWIERFELPTWLDYVRHNERRTQADVENYERLRALHRGSYPLVVHRMIERETSSLPDAAQPPREIGAQLNDPMLPGQ